MASVSGIAFVVLKLTHYIDWPWLWVLAPFWGPLALALSLLVLAGLATGLATIFDGKKRGRK